MTILVKYALLLTSHTAPHGHREQPLSRHHPHCREADTRRAAGWTPIPSQLHRQLLPHRNFTLSPPSFPDYSIYRHFSQDLLSPSLPLPSLLPQTCFPPHPPTPIVSPSHATGLPQASSPTHSPGTAPSGTAPAGLCCPRSQPRPPTCSSRPPAQLAPHRRLRSQPPHGVSGRRGPVPQRLRLQPRPRPLRSQGRGEQRARPVTGPGEPRSASPPLWEERRRAGASGTVPGPLQRNSDAGRALAAEAGAGGAAPRLALPAAREAARGVGATTRSRRQRASPGKTVWRQGTAREWRECFV